MRKLERQDWLALSIPVIGSVLFGFFTGYEKGWLSGATTFAFMVVSTIWIWRRQIMKHPVDTWRVRL